MNPIGRAAKSYVNELWPEAAIAKLKELYAEGLTHGQIARQLPNRPTRNATIGKVNRLIEAGVMTYRGGNEVAAAHATAAAARRRRRNEDAKAPTPAQRHAWASAKPPNNHDAKPRPPKVAPPKPEAVPATARPWLTRLEGECRAPIGEPNADMLMCCAPAGHGTGGDYCEGHAARLFRKTERQQDEQRAKSA